jgi:hypothetical protein
MSINQLFFSYPFPSTDPVSVADDFNRADGGLGANWTIPNGTVSISSNGLYGGGTACWTGNTFSANQFAEGIPGTGSGAWTGPAVRIGNTGNDNYMASYAGGLLTIYRYVAGAATNLSSISGLTDPVVRIETLGSWIAAYTAPTHGGPYSLRLLTYDTSTASGYPGAVIWDSSGGPYFDNWYGGDLSSLSFTNLIQNGDMELDSNWASVSTPTINERTSAKSHSGTYSRHIVPNAAWQGIKSDTFTMTAGKSYTIVCYVWVEVTSAAVIVYEGDGSTYQVFSACGNIGSWGLFTYTWTVHTTGSLANVQFFAGAAETNLWVDDVVVVELPSTNLVVNGDMELDSNWANVNSPSTNERSTEQVHSGTYSRKCVATGYNEGVRSDNYTTTNGKTYYVSCWIYSPNMSEMVLIAVSGDGAHYPIVNTLGGTNNTWVPVTYSYTEAYEGSVGYVIIRGSSPGNSFFVDDVHVIEAP